MPPKGKKAQNPKLTMATKTRSQKRNQDAVPDLDLDPPAKKVPAKRGQKKKEPALTDDEIPKPAKVPAKRGRKNKKKLYDSSNNEIQEQATASQKKDNGTLHDKDGEEENGEKENGDDEDGDDEDGDGEDGDDEPAADLIIPSKLLEISDDDLLEGNFSLLKPCILFII